MSYLQASTQNPAGFRPFNTALYTGFENYAFLKRPQNTISRVQPAGTQLYKPPELSGILVTGAGRMFRRGRLGAIEMVGGAAAAQPISQMISRGTVTYQPPQVPPVDLPLILPPPSVPPVPTPVLDSDGVYHGVYSLPGNPTTPGSPFTPPSAAELGVPTSAGTSLPAPSNSAPVTALPGASSLSTWFNSSTWFAGIPNGYVALGIAAALFMFGKKRR